MFWEEKRRKPLPARRKHTVYKRAGGTCEKCGTRLTMSEGDFHHTRDPNAVPRAENIRFLCPNCHRKHGHKRRTIKKETLFGTEKTVKIVRKDVTKVEKAKKKKPKTKRVAKRGIFGEVIGYKTVKVRVPKAKKKIVAKKKVIVKKVKKTVIKKARRT